MINPQRILQACYGCRRAKVKCDGLRPQCAVCLRKSRQCHWPEKLVPGGYRNISFAHSPTTSTDTIMAPSSSDTQYIHVKSPSSDIPPLLKQRLLYIFSQTHHDMELCGCIQLDKLKDDNLSGEDLFLLQSVLALSALQVSDSEVKLDSHFSTAKAVVQYYRTIAQASSREYSDYLASEF